MGTKALDKRYAKHLAAILRDEVREKFDGNATAAARAMKVAQPQMSQILQAKGRGAGLSTLIRIRKFTRMTLDDLLGLEPLGDGRVDPRLRQVVEEVLADRERRQAKPAPRPSPEQDD